MKWPVPLLVGLGMLLPLPLVWLVGLGGRAPWAASEPLEVSPVLSTEERYRLLTYGRACTRSAECEPPLGCLRNAATGKGACFDSECLTDLQCQEALRCRTLRSEGNGPLLRSCDVASGERREGESCPTGLSLKERACQSGLFCNEGWCGRPCKLEEPATCPEHFACRPGLEGPSCVPSCARQGCPAGQRCVDLDGVASQCGEVVGEWCQEAGCPEGFRCAILERRATAMGSARMWMECAHPCGEAAPTCPEGSRCMGDMCLRVCEQEKPQACRPGEACVKYPALDTGLCKP